MLSGQACDPRSDQFSLAVILYELLAGQPAFVGAPDEPREIVVQRVLAEDPLPLCSASGSSSHFSERSVGRVACAAHLRDFVAALGGSVSRFSPPTEGRVAALPIGRNPHGQGWAADGARRAVGGVVWDFCSVRASFCFKSRGRSHRRSSPRRRLNPNAGRRPPLAPDAGMEVLLAKLPPLRSASDTPIAAKTATGQPPADKSGRFPNRWGTATATNPSRWRNRRRR